ncbi:MAG: hypothetical protein SVY15_02115 [Halobacteriota archaeon]|nr:hypothetical protein [Halobacteriota archaeon]
MYVSFESAKASAMIILLGVVFLMSFHLIKKRIKDFRIAALPAIFFSFLSVLAFYDFSIFRYIEETELLLATLRINESLGEFALGVVFVVVGFLSAYLLSTRLEQQEYRSLFHLVPGLLLIYFTFINPDISLIFLGICLTVFFVGEYFRQSDDENILSEIAKMMMNAALRGNEVEGYVATLFFLIGAIIVVLFLPSEFAIGSILVATVGDPSAVLIGRSYGRHKWNHNPAKSLEGSGAMFLVSALALIATGFFPIMVALVVSLCATLFESLPIKVSDNLIIPLICGMVLKSIGGW